MGLGEELRTARLEKNLTASEVAAATRMMVQIVEELEREDFRRFAAPIYGKGFIKLYAEYVGLDPRPLIDEYVEKSAQGKTLSLKSQDAPAGTKEEEPVVEPAHEAAPETVVEDTAPQTSQPFESMPLAPADGPEPDLFSRLSVRDKRTPPPRMSPEPKLEPPPVQSSSRLLDETAAAALEEEPERPLWGEEQTAIAEKINRLRDAQRWRKSAIGSGSFDFSSSPFRLPLILAGVLLVLLVLIGLLNRCSGGGGPLPGGGARDDRPTELRLAEDPPDPSFGVE